ncbi:DUF1616 domain-containing protein [Natronosalvus vescus]|uniref:DUF1616 domain-containing protein n=1 Tax=Natronosalvus vescus TaxID=2953881 RepID=UPI002090A2AA|nr:DUF1616 domain-containing protein [Natronosalvus vescus]
MNAARSLWLLLPRHVRHLPADLSAVVGMVVLTNVAVFAPLIRETPLRVPVGLVFILFVPGYAFIAALFPEQGDEPVTGTAHERDADSSDSSDQMVAGWVDVPRPGIDGIERVAVSFGLSIAIVPLIGLGLNFTPLGIRLTPIMIAVSGFTLPVTAIAAYRRWELPVEERFRVPYRQWWHRGRAELFEADSRADALLNLLLVASIVLAVGSIVFAIAVPPQGEQFSELYILTEDDDGDLVASGYPTEFAQGESAEIVLGIGNNEQRTVNYTVVVVEQDVETVDNDSIVHEQRELQRFHTQVAHNETWLHTHDIAPTIDENDTRIVWLLYVDDVPADPTSENADYTVHLWVDVGVEPDEDG